MVQMHRTFLGAGSNSANPLGVASIMGDVYQIIPKSNYGSLVMNINQVESPCLKLWDEM
jgi:hypothetical protein